MRLISAPITSLAKHVSYKNVLLVTSPGFVRRGVVKKLCYILAPRNVIVWDRVKPNPDLQDLDSATVALQALGIDGVVGLGGGSVLDTSKVLATTLFASSSFTLRSIFQRGIPAPWSNRLPLILIPTTSGTGSEVTPFATIWDHSEYKKFSLMGDYLYPDLALLDTDLTLSLGNDDTFYPALDAMSHALESLWNKNSSPISRAFAFQALSLSNRALPAVQDNYRALESRHDLQTASVMAGLAISQTRTAIAHSISYPLTSHYGVPHGLACSFTLPYLLCKNLDYLARDESERLILVETLNFLRRINLSQILLRLVNQAQILELVPEMLTSGRADNYQGQKKYDFDEILENSLNTINTI